MFRRIGMHITGVLLFVVIFVSASFFTGLGNDVVFDSDTWLRSNARERGRMAQHLVDHRSLVGLSAWSVRSKLGAPEHDWGQVHQYRIDLGWPMKNPNTYGLQVHFDAERNVSLVKIVD